MILVWLILIPFIGGLLAWLANLVDSLLSRGVALLAVAAQFVIALILWGQYWPVLAAGGRNAWLVDFQAPWFPLGGMSHAGINFHFAMDGLSLVLVTLTGFLGIFSVVASWQGIQTKVGFFHLNLLGTLAGITGVFLSFDLFVFYFFWELMLIPLYFLVALWGYERRQYAALKLFLFTQLGGLFLLLGILGLFFIHGASTGNYTFDYFQLLGTHMGPKVAFWLMLAFFISFAVKLPVVPLHTWLPDAHTQAPTAGSVVLAGLVLKAGAYGLLRFVVPFFPVTAMAFAPAGMLLGVISIIYGAIQAFGQTDVKRLVAYTSVSHMGFVLLGVSAWNELALQGVVMILIAHGVTTGAMFALIGFLTQRTHSREMSHMGGLFTRWPRMGGVGLFLVLALLGLPGLGNFIGEFLVLLGTFRVSPLYAIIASLGFIVSVVYALWFMQRVFFGPLREGVEGEDLVPHEMALMTAAIIVALLLGLYPQPLFTTTAPSLRSLMVLVRTGFMPMATVPDGTPVAMKGGSDEHE